MKSCLTARRLFIKLKILLMCFCLGLSQYSGDPRTEWQLNTFTSKHQLLEAVRNFKYKGGNTFTGTDTDASSSLYYLSEAV